MTWVVQRPTSGTFEIAIFVTLRPTESEQRPRPSAEIECLIPGETAEQAGRKTAYRRSMLSIASRPALLVETAKRELNAEGSDA